MARTLRIGEVAELAGISVRTLHHYDQIGILTPSARNDGNQRLYTEDDLLRLQQILTLRYLGFQLRRIGELLERPDFDLVASLVAQRHALRDRVAELQEIEGAVNALLFDRMESGSWDWSLVRDATGAVGGGLSRKENAMEQYYTPEQMARFKELEEKTPREEIRAIEQGWSQLLIDIRENLEIDPASEKAGELLDRWDALFERMRKAYEGYEDLWNAIGENYEAGVFEDQPGAPGQAEFAFIEEARKAQQGQ
ncbi:MAG: MerR family transcriptional regulator [Chloroflexota bacterium]